MDGSSLRIQAAGWQVLSKLTAPGSWPAARGAQRYSLDHQLRDPCVFECIEAAYAGDPSADRSKIQASSSCPASRGQIFRSAPFEVIDATNGAGVAATNRAILGIDPHSISAIAGPVEFFIRMTMTRAAFSLIDSISCVR